MGRLSRRRGRQAIPVLLVALLTLATAAAAVAGATATHSPTPSFVQRSLTATTHAGSAQFTFMLVTKVAGGPEGPSTSTGFGSLNFAAGTSDIVMKMRAIESVSTPGQSNHQVPEVFTLQEIHTPRGTYQRPTFGSVPVSQPWSRIQDFPVPSGPLGLLQVTPVAVAIAPLLTQASSIRWHAVGTATVGGTATTEYQRAPDVRKCTTTGAAGFIDRTSNRISLWLDRNGRIRQVQTVSTTDERGGGGGGGGGGRVARGVFTSLGTLTFSSFGRSTSITAPPLGGGGGGGSGGAFSEGFAVSSGRGLKTSCGP